MAALLGGDFDQLIHVTRVMDGFAVLADLKLPRLDRNTAWPRHLTFQFESGLLFDSHGSPRMTRRLGFWSIAGCSVLRSVAAGDAPPIHPSRHVADPIHLHLKLNAPATAAIKACHQNNRGRAAFIERKQRMAPTITP
jgi:hypothetical protein